jgi:PBP1b-binding outer membrane lipoprotein LpoB
LKTTRLLAAVALVAPLSLLPACFGPSVTRASDDPEIDEPAMSTGFDRVDLELALETWIEDFEESSFVRGLDRQPSIAVLKISNQTSEHISGALDSLLDSCEVHLVRSGHWNVVDNTDLSRNAIIAERLRNMSDSVDQETIAALGREYGIEYFVNGRVWDTSEKLGDVRRVQYYLFLRVTEVATGLVRHAEQVDITKQYER